MQRQFLRSGQVLASFKLDVATVMAQQGRDSQAGYRFCDTSSNISDRQFYHKWAVLTDPDDVAGGPKGYLKCDISIIAKGDAVKIPTKSERDEDDIEA